MSKKRVLRRACVQKTSFEENMCPKNIVEENTCPKTCFEEKRNKNYWHCFSPDLNRGFPRSVKNENKSPIGDRGKPDPSIGDFFNLSGDFLNFCGLSGGFGRYFAKISRFCVFLHEKL